MAGGSSLQCSEDFSVFDGLLASERIITQHVVSLFNSAVGSVVKESITDFSFMMF